MNECNHSLFLTSIACQLFKCMTPDEIALLAADLVQLGDTLAAMLARNEICNKDDQ